MVYLGSSHERLLNRATLIRCEGPYVFARGIPTEVGALKTDGSRILPESANLGPDELWAVDNMEYYKSKAAKNPGQWAYFDKKPTERQLAALKGDIWPEEDLRTPSAKDKAPEGG